MTRRGTTKDTKVGEEDDKEEDGMAEEEEGEEETKEDKQEEGGKMGEGGKNALESDEETTPNQCNPAGKLSAPLINTENQQII